MRGRLGRLRYGISLISLGEHISKLHFLEVIRHFARVRRFKSSCSSQLDLPDLRLVAFITIGKGDRPTDRIGTFGLAQPEGKPRPKLQPVAGQDEAVSVTSR